MKVEKVDRILIAVRHLEAALKLFSGLFELKFDEIKVDDGQKVKYTRSPLGFELIQSTSPDGPVDRFIERKEEGLYAVILKVPDINSAVREMEEKGLRLAAKPQTGGLKEAYFHPKDSYGVMIVLCEYQSKHGATIPESQS